MNYSLMSQKEKAEVLENAVKNNSPEEIADIMKNLGTVEFSARALGLACRFRGIETVKTLVQNGASFEIPKTEETEKQYCCYAGRELKKMRNDNYRSNFSLCLLNILKHIKGACCFKGVKLVKQIKRENRATLKLLPDEERLKVLKYLCENKKRISFYPSEMLYYAIFGGDDFIVAELKELGIALSEERKKILIDGGLYTDGYWYEYCSMTGKLSDDDYLGVMKKLAAELDGRKLHCTEKIYEITKERFANKETFEFFRDNFNYDKLNKTKIIRDLIDNNLADTLPLIEVMGWLNNTKRRDEMIQYSQDISRPECTAFLLDFKNRTADFASEREKADKKMLAELNAASNSVMMLKKIWSYKKGEDGNLIITNYKGNSTEVTIPEKIGKGIVTAIGKGAFAGGSGLCGGIVSSYASFEQMKAHRNITKIVLPQGIRIIDTGAFADMTSLKEINIPDTVEEIADAAFFQSVSLRELVIPGVVKKIGKYAFAHCNNLRSVKICEGVLEIGAGAFKDNSSLATLVLPKSLKRFISEKLMYFTVETLNSAPNMTVYCPKGSCAEEYCKLHNIKFLYSSEDK